MFRLVGYKYKQKNKHGLLIVTCLFLVYAIYVVCTFYSPHMQIHAQSASNTQQQQVGVYTVTSGDTLYSIAARFSISFETLVQFNGITDPDLIRIGDVLLIPSTEAANAINSYSGEQLPDLSTTQSNDSVATQAIADQVTEMEAIAVQALPGESVDMVALRYAQDRALVALLNNLPRSQRLFPGQTILIPKATTSSNGILGQKGVEPLRFGAVTQVTMPDTLIQGHTGRLWVQTSRAISLTGTWNGLPIVFSRPEITPIEALASSTGEISSASSAIAEPFTQTRGNLWFSLLPVPALIEPQVYPMQISYIASNGVKLSRTWQVEVFAGNYDRQEIVLGGGKGGLLISPNAQTELDLVISTWSKIDTPLLWNGTFTRPINEKYSTTSPFGTRRSYNGGPYSSYHAGQDFGAPAGVPIIAPAPGIVALSERLNVRGNAVILDHGRGIFTGYWHLSEILAKKGQLVQAGDLLGLVGTTGLSTGAHLHWELRIYGIAVDPIQFTNEQLIELP